MNPDNLTPKQLAKYEDALEVLRLMRQGQSITKASKQVGLSPSTVKKYVGSVLYSKNNRLVARQTDSLLRKIRIYENGQEDFILIRGRKNVTIIAQYMSAVGRRIDNNDTSALKSFEKIIIIDAKGNHHKLETDVKKLIKIFEKREEPEFFTIYQRK
jgi:hypothetical protein